MSRLLISTLLIFVPIYAQWTNLNTNPNGETINSVSYADSTSIWAAGTNGLLLKSIDKGCGWTSIQGVVSDNIYSINFYDAENGAVAGENGMLLLTSDGGENWNTANYSTSLDLRDLLWVEENVLIAAGEDGLIIKGDFTLNTWVDRSGYNTGKIYDLYMKSDTIWAVGQYGEAQISLDSAETWGSLSDIGSDVYSIVKNKGWYYASGGSISYLSFDEGSSWFDISVNPNETINRYYSTDNALWTIGDDIDFGSLLKRDNIKDYSSRPVSSLSAIDFYDSDNGVIGGMDGVIITTKNDGADWNSTISGTAQDLLDVVFPSDSVGYILSVIPGYYVELPTAIFKTTDGGNSWCDIHNDFYSNSPSWINFFNDSVGVLNQKRDNIITTDGGKTWEYSFQQNEYFGGSDFIDSFNGYIVSGSKIYSTTDAGTNWLENSIPGYETSEFYDVDFIDANTGFIAGDSLGNALVLRTTDGGTSWEGRVDHTDGINIKMISISAISESSINILGETDIVLHSNDLFESYSQISVDPLVDFNSINFKDILNGTIVGDNGSMFYTVNGGVSWSSYTSGVVDNLNNVYYTQNGDGWVTGDYFTLLKLDKDNPPLPVEMISFNVYSRVDNNTVEWSTASEINSYSFEVEKKYENNEWKKIGNVATEGNSSVRKDYSFTDWQVKNGTNKYRLKQTDINGECTYSDVITVQNNMALTFALNQNYPNPFNPTTNIKFSIPNSSEVKLLVYNVLGEEVAKIVNNTLESGTYNYSFDASKLSSGVYIYRLSAVSISNKNNSFEQIKKMVLLK